VNRKDVIVQIAAHEAAAAALREALTTEARTELEENHTAPSWTLEDGSRVTVNTTSGGAVVTDNAAFIDWAREAYPGEMIERTTVDFRNATFRKRVIAELAAHAKGEGIELPAFLAWTQAGVYHSTSITIAPETKKRMAASARAYALAGETMPELETGNG